jgi:hypothetical protein
MKASKLIAVGLLFAMISSSPASALFGSECRKPKSSFNAHMALSKKLNKDAYKFSPREKAAFYRYQKKMDEQSLNICLEGKSLTREECKAISNLPPDSGLVHTDILAQSRKALDTAYRIVINNKKCFDPLIVVDAQRFFGK